MKIEEILTLPETQWLDELQKDPVSGRNVQSYLDYYDGKHEILTDPDRADYTVDKYQLDENGDKVLNEQTGRPIKKGADTIKRTRLVLNYQRQIIDTAIGMCVGEPVTLTLNNNDSTAHEEAFEIFVDQWRNKARMDSFSIGLLRSLMKESKVAEILFVDPDDENQDIKPMILSLETGDQFWAHFNDDRKMDALIREYEKRMLVGTKFEDVVVVQIWTSDKLYTKTGDAPFEQTQNPYEKITCVYYDQKKPEYEIVKDLIKKIEYVRSQNSDVNKRIGNPNVVIDGIIDSMPDIEQDVKVWNAKPTADAEGKTVRSDVKYLQLEGAPEAIKMELEAYERDMYKLTWPDLSFLRESIKTGNLSGTAIRLMFTDAFIKIGLKREILEDFSRRVSVMKRILAVTRNSQIFEELNISVGFNSILPDNIAEITDTLAAAVQNEITSKAQAQSIFKYNNGNNNIQEEIEEEKGRDLTVGGIV